MSANRSARLARQRSTGFDVEEDQDNWWATLLSDFKLLTQELNPNTHWKRQERERIVQRNMAWRQVMHQYGGVGAKYLDRREVSCLLRDLDPQKQVPTTDEVNFVVALASTEGSGLLSQQELTTAVKEWVQYLKRREEAAAKLLEFDRNKNGRLEHSELKELMSSMNAEVTEKEVESVMDAADMFGEGSLGTPQIVLALEAWQLVLAKRRPGISSKAPNFEEEASREPEDEDDSPTGRRQRAAPFSCSMGRAVEHQPSGAPPQAAVSLPLLCCGFATGAPVVPTEESRSEVSKDAPVLEVPT